MRMLKILLLLFLVQLMVVNISGDTGTVRIKAVGDIMMGTLYPREVLPPGNSKPLESVAELLDGGDILFGNFESTFSTVEESGKDVSKKNYYAFNTPFGFGKYLKDGGFDILNIANNHSLDFGESGLSETIFNLQINDLSFTGLRDFLHVQNIDGVRVGFLGFYWTDYFNNYNDRERVKEIIARGSERVDILVVTFHGGAEGAKALHIKDEDEFMGSSNRGNVIEFAHLAVESGADLVLGHGPHVVRAMEFYRGKLIAYSLGNFFTYGMFNMESPTEYFSYPRCRP